MWASLTDEEKGIVQEWVKLLNKTMPKHLTNLESYLDHNGFHQEIVLFEDELELERKTIEEGKIPEAEKDFYAKQYKKFRAKLDALSSKDKLN